MAEERRDNWPVVRKWLRPLIALAACGVLLLFLVILAIGLASVAWMLKAGFRAPSGRTQQ